MRETFVRIVLIALAASLVSACIFFPSAKDRAIKNSPSFKEGYGDGCAAASTQSSNYREGPYRDKALYASDANYRAGWGNGYQACRAPQDLGTLPGQNPVPQPIPSH